MASRCKPSHCGAATNRSDVLDPALTRPGRFDRTVQVMLPDIEGRRQILGVHSGKVRMSPDVDMERVARAPMFSGAELALITKPRSSQPCRVRNSSSCKISKKPAIRFGTAARRSRRIEARTRSHCVPRGRTHRYSVAS